MSTNEPVAAAREEDLLSAEDRIRYARVLVEIGELYDAEIEVAHVLEERPEDLTALDLLAKIKHMRGELSAAIACWAQVHAKSPSTLTAHVRLNSMMQLAQESERGPGQFLVLGPFQLWRKPAAHLELEEVFRLFLARRPDEAKERCEQLARSFERVSVLGHLASLYARLGDPEEAARHEKRFLRLFCLRMHRPTFSDAVHAATRRYVPLSKLSRVRFAEMDGLSEPTPRERAIELFLAGDSSGARELLNGWNEVLDLKYRADLAVLAGSPAEGVSLYLQSLESDPDDVRVLEWLLNDYESSRSARIEEYFKQPGISERALERLDASLRASPLRPSLWTQVASLHQILGHGEEAGRSAQRAESLEEAADRRQSTVGRVLADSVYHFVGRAKGLIHEVWVARRPAAVGRGGFLEEILGNLTPEFSQAVRNTFLSVREYARAKWPQQTRDILDYTYTYKVTKEDEASGGLSAGLPTALAFLSVFLNRPVPQYTASTGILIADSHDVQVLRAVGEPEYKVRGAYNRNLQKVILPEANRRDLEGNACVPRVIYEEIVRYASNLDEAVVLTFGSDVWIT